MTQMAAHRVFILLYTLSLLFVGLGYLSILPAFEGHDEPAHYSSVRQISGTGTIPIYDQSFLDDEIVKYRGPLPYVPLGNPLNGVGQTYKEFFASPTLVESYSSSYRQSSTPSFQPSELKNWQAQHPPLYYLVLAVVTKATENRLSFLTQFLTLRLASLLIALAGIILALLASVQIGKPLRNDPAVIGFLVYPLILPMFFIEFARIGNDSLCLFLNGATAFLLSKWLKDQSNRKLSVAIGITLGLGLLTKAFFLPIIAALGTFLLLYMRSEGSEIKLLWKKLTLIFLPAVLIGGGWYVYKLMAFGDLIGSDDAIRLAANGGFVAGLRENFTAYAVGRGIVALFKSYVWAGTASLTKLPAIFFIPSLALLILMSCSFVLQIKGKPLTDHSSWLPVWLFVFFGCGFFYQILVHVAGSGVAGTPGWYIHILMPWVAPALGAGICSLLEIRHSRTILIGLLFYAAAFQAIALWSEVALYTGCAGKTDDSYYAFPGHDFCLDRAPEMLERLYVLGWPIMTAIGFGGGFIVAVSLIRIMLREKLEIRARQ